jgi:hypothetical protein
MKSDIRYTVQMYICVLTTNFSIYEYQVVSDIFPELCRIVNVGRLLSILLQRSSVTFWENPILIFRFNPIGPIETHLQDKSISTLRTRFTNKKQQFGLRAQPALGSIYTFTRRYEKWADWVEKQEEARLHYLIYLPNRW